MLNKLFKLKENHTTIRTEVIGGATTFLTMSYIIFVQPAVLAAAGMDFGAVMTATCISTAVATLLMGLIANYPIALAPAMGHNFFFVYNICLGLNITWQVALGANFISSAATTAFVWVRKKIITAIPVSLQHAIAVGIGLLITLIGFEWSGMIKGNPGTLIGLGDLTAKPVILALIGVFATMIFMGLNIQGPLFLGIILTCLAGLFMGVVKYEGIVSMPPSIVPTLAKLDIRAAFNPNLLSAIFVLFFLDLFDSVGTLVGVGKQAHFIKKDGTFPRMKRSLIIDASTSMLGTTLGTTTITSYIESSAGIVQGARTGLANVVTALLFLVSLFFYPLIKMIGGGLPQEGGITLYPVIAPALIIVGSLMLKNARDIDWDDITESLPAFLAIVIIPFTFSITEGIAFGFISYSVLKLVTGKYKQVSWLIYLFSVLFVIRYFIKI